MGDKDRATQGKTKAKDVVAKLDASVGLPVGSVTVDGKPIDGGGVMTLHHMLPLKHPTKDERKWRKNPHLEYLIAQGVIEAADAPIMSGADASDPEWANAKEDDLA